MISFKRPYIKQPETAQGGIRMEMIIINRHIQIELWYSSAQPLQEELARQGLHPNATAKCLDTAIPTSTERTSTAKAPAASQAKGTLSN